MSFPQNIAKCTFCEWGANAGKACNGRCPCRKDKAGRDIAEIAQTGDCPLQIFTEAGPLPSISPVASRLDIPLPGDVIESLAKVMGADKLTTWWEEMTGQPCGCQERRDKINKAALALKEKARQFGIHIPFAQPKRQRVIARNVATGAPSVDSNALSNENQDSSRS